MEQPMRYALTPEGEIVKVLDHGYEYTGMYVMR